MVANIIFYGVVLVTWMDVFCLCAISANMTYKTWHKKLKLDWSDKEGIIRNGDYYEKQKDGRYFSINSYSYLDLAVKQQNKKQTSKGD